MAISLKKVNKLFNNERTVAIPLGDSEEALTLSYTRNRLTGARELELRDKMQDNMPINYMADFLSSMLTNWNLADPNGDGNMPAPITFEWISTNIGIEVMQAMVQAIFNDLDPNLPTSVPIADSYVVKEDE